MKTKDQRREEAEARKAAAQKRSPQEQLARLDRYGFRAAREREKLERMLNDRG